MGETKVDPSQLDEAAITDIKTDGGSVQPDTRHINFQSPLAAEVDGDGVDVSIGSIAGLSGEAADAQTPKTHSNTAHTPAMVTISGNVTQVKVDEVVGGGETSLHSHGAADFQYIEDEDEDTNDTATYAEKVSLVWTPPVASNYLIQWTFAITSTSASRPTKAKIEIDDTDILNEVQRAPEDANAYLVITGFKRVYLTAAEHNVDIDFGLVITSGNPTAKIRRARIMAQKVA